MLYHPNSKEHPFLLVRLRGMKWQLDLLETYGRIAQSQERILLWIVFWWGPLPDLHSLICRDIDAISIYLMTKKRGLRLQEHAFPQFQEQVVLV